MTDLRSLASHALNDRGLEQAKALSKEFSSLLAQIETLCGSAGFDMTLARQSIRDGWAHAYRAMASRPENQKRGY